MNNHDATDFNQHDTVRMASLEEIEYMLRQQYEQPKPKPSSHPAAWSLVISDMANRDIIGADKYGTRLQPNNGRDSLRDAYEEALDLAVYLRNAIYERDSK